VHGVELLVRLVRPDAVGALYYHQCGTLIDSNEVIIGTNSPPECPAAAAAVGAAALGSAQSGKASAANLLLLLHHHQVLLLCTAAAPLLRAALCGSRQRMPRCDTSA
jgi:hypothetical protein